MSFRLDYTLSSTRNSSIPNPPGFLAPTSTSSKQSSNRRPDVEADLAVLQAREKKATDLKMKRAWDLALAPAKSLPMQAVMLYFSGSGIQIFSLGMIFMLLTGPIGAVLNIFKAFEALRPLPPPTPTPALNSRTKNDAKPAPVPVPGEPIWTPLIGPMLLYIACQGLVLALGLYKCSSMGILPTGSGDWLHLETRSDPPEWSAVRAQSLA